MDPDIFIPVSVSVDVKKPRLVGNKIVQAIDVTVERDEHGEALVSESLIADLRVGNGTIDTTRRRVMIDTAHDLADLHYRGNLEDELTARQIKARNSLFVRRYQLQLVNV